MLKGAKELSGQRSQGTEMAMKCAGKPLSLTCRLMCSMALAICSLSACSHDMRDLQPPVKLPFDAGLPAAENELRVRIKKADKYAIGLSFYYNQDDSQGRAMSELLGVFKVHPDGSTSERGIPANFRVSVRRLDAATPVLEQVVERPHSLPSHKSRYVDVAALRLDPGLYLVGFAVMDNAPELSGARAELYVVRAYQGK